MPRIKVLVSAYGDSSSASARIRAWNRLASVSDILEVEVYSGNEIVDDYDILYIQKRVNDITIELVRKAYWVGTPIVFDIDDALGMSAAEDLNIWMLRMANHVVVDTRFKKEEFAKYTRVPITVIPDGVDYFTQWNEIEIKSPVTSVCTFGWEHNLIAARPYIDFLAKHYNTGYIGDKPLPDFISVPFIKWEIGSFIKVLKSFDCAIIAHGDHSNDRLRCCNRFMTAVMAGVLPIVKDTLEYRETLLELDAGNLLVNSPEQAMMTIRCIENHIGDFLPALRKKVWDLYQPRVGGLKLVDVFEEAMNA